MSSAELRALVEDALVGGGFELTPDLCIDWFEREDEILELMTETILEGLAPLQPGDPDEVRRVSAEVIKGAR